MKVKTCETNPYVELMYTEFSSYSFDEEAIRFKGKWRSEVYDVPDHTPFDLEIGTGNGTHFTHLTEKNPDRIYMGLELKFKTLVQSIRRSVRAGCINSRMAKFRAEQVSELFDFGEINNVYIHFPDPWPKKRHHKNRLIQPEFLGNLNSVMASGSLVEFKTDNCEYFKWATHYFRSSPFQIEFYSEDLHNSFRRDNNFVTHFESLFLNKQQPIYYCLLRKK